MFSSCEHRISAELHTVPINFVNSNTAPETARRFSYYAAFLFDDTDSCYRDCRFGITLYEKLNKRPCPFCVSGDF